MKKSLILLFWILPFLAFTQYEYKIIGSGSSWKYWDSTYTDLPDSSNWRAINYNSSQWRTGNAPLGYNYTGLGTSIRFGPNQLNKHRSAYFRKEITLVGYLDEGDTLISHPAAVYKLRVRHDDGVAVFINGHLVYRDNLPIPFNFFSYAPVRVEKADNFLELYIDPHILKIGTNVVTAEVHQNANDSSDLIFDLELIALRSFPFQQTALIRYTDSWKYLDNDTDPGSSWKTAGFNDASWTSGIGEFGYGEGDETTILNYGSNPNARFITTYFRKLFNLSSTYDLYKIRFRRDDGIVIYINGNEYYRDNFKFYENITKSTYASNAEDDGNIWDEIFLKGDAFINGQNIIAVEIHQALPNSSDVSFFFELVGLKTGQPFIGRGPYLQKGTPTSMTFKWNTNQATIGLVRYGTDPTNLSSSSAQTASAIGHTVSLTGLSPNTKYYYSIETNSAILERTSDNYFTTNPTVGSEKKTRIWAMGCFGSGELPQRLVQERFLEYIRNKDIDMSFQMGDLAYPDATEDDFQRNYFQPYQNYRTMKQTPIYPSLGNHEYWMGAPNYYNFDGTAYKNIFDTFTSAEAGGVASNTKRYYSFNYGNIHVVSIDPHGIESTTNKHVWETGSEQRQWLINDLAANTQKWTIILVHTPPYSKGKHDSDNQAEEPEMWGVRNNLVDIFDQYKVDLVLAAHSHNYERSKLIKGFKGIESQYVPATYEVSTSSGKYDGTANSCAYLKNSTTGGTVYAVVGSGGRLETGVQATWPHDAMAASTNITHQGSYLIEIEGNRMDVKWVSIDNEPNVVKDNYTIFKDLNLTAENVNVPTGTPNVTLTAPWTNGNFLWSNGATTNSITVAAVNNANYTVTDGSTSCLSKAFTLIVNNCPATMTISNAITSGTVKYEVSQTISATNTISNANVTYDAGKSVTLSPGFSVAAGSVFKAYIDGCGNLRVRNEPQKE